MKTPTKADLWDTIDHLTRENQKLADKLDRERIERWERLRPQATALAQSALRSVFGCLIFNLRYEHVDAAGYWYSFELTNDNRRQTYCVWHTEVEYARGC